MKEPTTFRDSEKFTVAVTQVTGRGAGDDSWKDEDGSR